MAPHLDIVYYACKVYIERGIRLNLYALRDYGYSPLVDKFLGLVVLAALDQRELYSTLKWGVSTILHTHRGIV